MTAAAASTPELDLADPVEGRHEALVPAGEVELEHPDLGKHRERVNTTLFDAIWSVLDAFEHYIESV